MNVAEKQRQMETAAKTVRPSGCGAEEESTTSGSSRGPKTSHRTPQIRRAARDRAAEPKGVKQLPIPSGLVLWKIGAVPPAAAKSLE